MRTIAIWLAMTLRPGRWNNSWVRRSPIGLPSGRSRVAKCSRCERLAAWDEPFDDGVGKVAGFSLHAGVAARADQRQKLERLCRYISRPTIAEQRLSCDRAVAAIQCSCFISIGGVMG